ncbi:MAG: NUDIX domain-containing protein [Chloroflexi bacterium]|nr:NUDIX domain-containing protein [Chloroflexota bacterium]
MTKIRTIAIGMIWRGDQFLVGEFDDPKGDGYFYRPLGGGVEFGEYGRDALKREIGEELQCNIGDIEYLTMLENIFTYKDAPYHEIVLLYQCRLLKQSLYQQDIIEFDDDDGRLHAIWKALSFFENGGPPLYPDGLFEYLRGWEKGWNFF